MQSARTVTLSRVITELFPFLICNSKLVRSISLKVLKLNKWNVIHWWRAMRERAECKNHNHIVSIYGVISLPNICNIKFVRCISLKVWKRINWNLIHWETAIKDSAECKNCNSVTSSWVTSRLKFCNNKLVRSISLKEFYSFINKTLPLLRIFGVHHLVSPILLFIQNP